MKSINVELEPIHPALTPTTTQTSKETPMRVTKTELGIYVFVAIVAQRAKSSRPGTKYGLYGTYYGETKEKVAQAAEQAAQSARVSQASFEYITCVGEITSTVEPPRLPLLFDAIEPDDKVS